MKTYRKLFRYALKEQMEYRFNFSFSILTIIINDAAFLIIFAIFLSYFSSTGLTLGSFLLLFALNTLVYALINGIFANIGELPNLIEQGKLDYYLSFPVKTLPFLMVSKIKVHNLGDLFFSLLAFVAYILFFLEGNRLLFSLKALGVSLLGGIFGFGLFVLIGSVGFVLQRGSKLRDLFQSFFLVFGSYPPEVFEQQKLILPLLWLIGIFPSAYLPYWILIGKGGRETWLALVLLSGGMLRIGIQTFQL